MRHLRRTFSLQLMTMLLVLGATLIAPTVVFAGGDTPATAPKAAEPSKWGQALIGDINTAANESYRTEDKVSIATTLGTVINTAIGALGTAAVFLIIYAGYLWMTAGGNEEQVTKSKTIIKQVIVGFVVLSLAYGIVSFVYTSLISKAGGQTAQPR